MKKILFLVFLIALPVSLSALIMEAFDDPHQSRGLPDNAITDIVTHDGAVWMITGLGLAYVPFNDSTWNVYDTTNGLISQDISAIYSDPATGALWAANNYFSGDSLFAAGLSFTSDNGRNWDTITPPGSAGFVRVVYDLAGYKNTIFGASFYGGLFGSFDNGQTWRQIYSSRTDSLGRLDPDPPYASRYFAAATDSLHKDSLVLWGGTASGIWRYVYAPLYAKLSSGYIYDLTSSEEFVYICGDAGLTTLRFDSTISKTYIPIYHSSFEKDGLPGQAATTAYRFGGRLFAGTLDTLGGTGSGLAVSENNGLDFHTDYSGLDSVTGENKYPREFASIGSRLYMAAYEAGLYVSSDTGTTWEKVYPDTLDTTLASGRNIVYSVAADSSNLWIGTDSGVVLICYDPLGALDSIKYFVFPENDTSGARSYHIGIQKYTDSSGNVDSTAIWTINHPIDTLVGKHSIFFSRDYGQTWKKVRPYTSPVPDPFFDIGFTNKVIYLVGFNKFAESPNRTFWISYDGRTISQYGNPSVNFNNLRLNAFLAVRDTIYIGSEHGMALSPPGGTGIKWNIVIANTDTTRHDTVTNYVYPYLSGNFVNVLGVQTLPEGQSRLWASTRATDTLEHDGITTSSLDALNWRVAYDDVQCWNFAFNGPEVFAATSSGLLYSSDTGKTWETLLIRGIQVSSDPAMDYSIAPSTPVRAVEVVGDTLWAGTDDGAAKIALARLGNPEWRIYRTYDSSFTTYAYPVPFSHARNSNMLFHYNVAKDAYVSIDVYDFAMNLVRTVVDNQFRSKGIYNSDQWDGLNGSMGLVAVGMYYFKISLSTGETYWGKLAIVP